MSKDEITSYGAATEFAKYWKHQGLQIGFTNGCFDLLHLGHRALLKSAALFCDRLVVGLNSDRSVCNLKGPTRPIQDELVRAAAIEAIEGVNLVIIFDEETPLKLIQAIRPDVIIKGGDYTKQQIVGADFVSSYGGRCEIVKLVEGYSTTNSIKSLLVANVAE